MDEQRLAHLRNEVGRARWTGRSVSLAPAEADELLAAEERATRAEARLRELRPANLCTMPKCSTTVKQDGECWTCPACAARVEAERDRLREAAQDAKETLAEALQYVGGKFLHIETEIEHSVGLIDAALSPEPRG